MTSSNLKIIACISMLIDHIGAILFPNILIFRIIGRIAFPIFAFLIVEGYYHTKNINNYLLRLGVFSLISEIPFDRAFNNSWLEYSSQNVFFTLFIGLVAIALHDKYKDNNKVLSAISIIALAILNEIIRADYGVFGVLIIFSFYKFRGQKKYIILWLFLINAMVALVVSYISKFTLKSSIQFFELLSLPIIFNYNGKKGLKLKYVFYFFYPVHLIAIYGISLLLY